MLRNPFASLQGHPFITRFCFRAISTAQLLTIPKFLLLSSLAICWASQTFAASSNHEEIAMDAALLALDLGVESQQISKNEEGRREFPTQSLDLRIRKVVHGEQAQAEETEREQAFRQFSDAGVVLLAGSSIGFWLGGGHTDSDLVVAHAFLINNLITSSLKFAFHRQRPRTYMGVEGEISEDDVASFPSGHASNAFVAARLLARYFDNRLSWVAPTSYLLAGLVAYSRMAADRHFFSDTVAGAAIGIASTDTGQMIGRGSWVDRLHVRVYPNLVSLHFRW